MRIRIIKPPDPNDRDLIEGFDVSRLRVGKVYDISARLGELLVLCGYADIERRAYDRAADESTKAPKT